MDAVPESVTEPTPRKRWLTVTPAVELAVLAAAIIILIATYQYVSGETQPGQLMTPTSAALLLFANLLPAVVLIILLGRRIAKYKARKTALAGGGRLHVRLVAMFSVIASVPVIFTAIVASATFQSGVQLWGSERANTAFQSTMALAKEGQDVVSDRWAREARAMVGDVLHYFPDVPKRSAGLEALFLEQTYRRNFYHSAIFEVPDGKTIEPLYVYEEPDEKAFAARVTGAALNVLKTNDRFYINFNKDLVWVITPIDRTRNIFLYVATPVNADFLTSQTDSAREILAEYNQLQTRARSLQVKFNAGIYALAVLILGAAMWLALLVADRLVGPVDRLVIASRRVSEGDFEARVPTSRRDDEIGTLNIAFNAMTEQLQHQTNALVNANAQLETRRALIEAVMSGISAGVISVDADNNVRLINESARALLRHADDDPVGKPLAGIAPELDAMLAGPDDEAVVQVNTAGEARTLAVKITRDEGGRVLTFDDITQQLLDQRRAAWSDVARRIAHEIKNPLTPIQLAAERLQRRYGKQNEGEKDGTFARLTETIVRQVGDLRRIVDEFSSFARMPKPIFRTESLLDIARQSMFLHEVAHPTIQFTMDAPDEPVALVCDRRQIGQALTNVVKNAVEAVEARGEGEALPQGEIVLTLTPDEDRRVILTVADNGIGLPVERDRIVEPYMTTRQRGTGLGLAIVKKIVEEHFGTIAFADRPGGGTIVSICFDSEMLANLDTGDKEESAEDADRRLPALTRNGPKS